MLTKTKPFILETDVLIVGGGYSGSWAAISASNQGAKVLIADKGPRDWWGLGMFSGGDMIACHPGEDDIDTMLDELVYYYDGLCEQDVILNILQQSYERFSQLENWGHKFARNDAGKVVVVFQRGLKYMRSMHYAPYGKGGIHLSETLNEQMREKGVERISNVEITELIKDGDRVSGAVGFHVQSGLKFCIQAKAIILATHIGGWKESYHTNTSCHEGGYLAAEAGARLRNMEFMQNWNIPKYFAWEGQTGLLPFGARFLNRNGEDFMKNYSELGAKSDPAYNIRGMANEVRNGRGPIMFDPTSMSSEGVEVMRPKSGWMVLNDAKLKGMGIDFFRDKTEWITGSCMSFGSIFSNSDGSTDVQGLYVCGRARNPTPGVYLGGWDTCMTSTTGYQAGKNAASFAFDKPDPKFERKEALERLDATMSLIGRPGVHPKAVVRRMQDIIAPPSVCIFKTAAGLNRALEQLEETKKTLIPRLSAQSPHYLLKLVEARGVAQLTEAYLRGSLHRQESRAGHYREDYPCRGDTIGWITQRKINGELVPEFFPAPIDKYPIKPYRYYMDNFKLEAVDSNNI